MYCLSVCFGGLLQSSIPTTDANFTHTLLAGGCWFLRLAAACAHMKKYAPSYLMHPWQGGRRAWPVVRGKLISGSTPQYRTSLHFKGAPLLWHLFRKASQAGWKHLVEHFCSSGHLLSSSGTLRTASWVVFITRANTPRKFIVITLNHPLPLKLQRGQKLQSRHFFCVCV